MSNACETERLIAAITIGRPLWRGGWWPGWVLASGGEWAIAPLPDSSHGRFCDVSLVTAYVWAREIGALP